ncbi:MAG: sugar transferase [Actinomycetota bacterium]
MTTTLRSRGAPASAYTRWAKPAFDRLVAATLLLVLAPLFALVAIGVRLTMGRGVIFRQSRVGRHGEDFTILKFRTMHHDRRRRVLAIDFVDRRLTHKSAHDPRHTRFGRFLRASSIDELPQLVNVLRGEMSLVGPRPEVSEVADAHGFRFHPRHDVLPGITGPWQISPLRCELLCENLDLDVEYVNEVSFRTDVDILARTVQDVVARAGA